MKIMKKLSIRNLALLLSIVLLMGVFAPMTFAEGQNISTQENIDLQEAEADRIDLPVSEATDTDSEELTAEDIARRTEGDLPIEQLANRVLPMEDVPEIVATESIARNDHVNRLRAQELDLNNIVFQNRDGTKTLYDYSTAVKYFDADGNIKDKSNLLAELGADSKFAFVTAENDIKTYFPKALNADNGILLEAGDVKIEISPLPAKEVLSAEDEALSDTAGEAEIVQYADNLVNSDETETFVNVDATEPNDFNTEPTAEMTIQSAKAIKLQTEDSLGRKEDTVWFDGVFGDDTMLRYTPDFNGYKEDIFLNCYTGQNVFDFVVKTGGLTLFKENGMVFFIHPLTGEKIANLGELVLYDSSEARAEKEFENPLYYRVSEIVPDEEYIVTIVVSREFLEAEDTVYPVVIDPTLLINNSLTGNNYIQDASMWSSSAGTNYNTSSMRLGYGSYRIAMQSKNLVSNMSVIGSSSDITNAQLCVNHVDAYTGSQMYVTVYRMTSSWEEGTITWNSHSGQYSSTPAGGNNYINTTSTPTGWINFNITNIVKAWKAGTYTNYGVMLKADLESSPRQWVAIAASEYGTTSQRPYMEITYNSSGVGSTPAITFYSQRPGYWGYSQSYWTDSNGTVWDPTYGCAMASAAMSLSSLGISRTPGALCKLCGSISVNWVTVTSNTGTSYYDSGFGVATSTIDQKIQLYLTYPNIYAPPIVYVQNTHYAVVISGSNGTYMTKDPYYGDNYLRTSLPSSTRVLQFYKN